MKTILLLLGLLITQVISFSQATHPYTNCPDVNIAIVRAGTNSDISNPYSLYNVNQSTGAMALVPGGPYKDPANTTKNLQVNGIGVSRKDGFIYGIAFDGTATTARFVRLDGSYGITDLGAIPSPTSATGILGIVNPAAGDMDLDGNFYFSAFTFNPLPTPTFDKFYIGKIANTQSLTTGPPTVQYYEVDVSGANCSNYISTLSLDPNNSGLKDFSFNSATNSFFTYATYKLPGASDFSAQLLELAHIPGSSPIRYRLICNATVNTHTTETSGTIIDKNGKFTVLFTDGSFGMLTQNASGVYTGAFTMITTSTGLPNPLRGDMGSCGLGSPNVPPPTTQPTPFPNCPDVDIAIARAGTNANVTNPYFLYNVNQSTGAMTLVPGGPYKDPANPSANLQVNGVGVSRKDGFIYGIAFDGTTTTARFMRLGANYGVTDLGSIPSPSSATGMIGVVNPAAGDMDTSGNFYFSAFTANLLPTPTIDKLFIGKISNTQSMMTGPPVVQYFEVDVSGANCSNYISTLTSDPNNSGLKDFSYNSKTNSFFTYATYKLPGAFNFSAQVLELVPITGSSPLRYRLVCNPTVNTHTAETAGTLIDKNGKFTVLFTDGSFGMVNGNASSGFNGGFTMITTNTGLPNPLRGDMGSCGQGSPQPANIATPFTTCPDVDVALVRSGTNADVTNPYFLYLVNQSTGAMTLVPGGPFKDPANPIVNLQVNGIGVSRKDGFIYGIAFNGGPASTTITARFIRLGSNYGAVDLGVIPPPLAGPGLLSFVNTAAGDMDTSGNYYFSAFTLNPLPSPTFVKFYLGKIANTQMMSAGPPIVEYFEVDVSGANCANYISTLTSDPNNSGLKDFSYNSKTNTFFTYATYKLPGASNFSAQLLELVPVTGSSPLRYRLVCNPTVNTHTAETSGTLIDKNGKFTVLFTDGSFGMLNGNASSGFNGGFTMITTNTGLPNPLRGDMGSCGQGASVINQPPGNPLTCPANFGVVRAGLNADITNPYSLYTVNGTTGAFTLLPGGPLLYPGTSQRLQLNGIGVNKADGMIYGMAFEGSLNTARFVKVDAAYNVTLLGNILPPLNSSGIAGFVNSAAGDIDNKGNYYFTAVTTKPGNGPNGMLIENLWLGKIANVASVTGTPVVTYLKIEWNGNPCKDFISSLTNDPINSGIKDLFYHPATKTFFTYATYKLAGDNQFRGQMLELKPVGGANSPGSYQLHCKNVVNMHNAETSGTMVTDEGEFLVLMTDGTVGRIARTGTSFNYSGLFVMLNGSTGLPSTLRGDLASCTNLKKHHGDNDDDDDDDDQGEDEDNANNGNHNNDNINCSLYPNPVGFNQNVVLRWTQVPNPMLVNILVLDNHGTIVRRVNNAMAVQGSQLSINISNLASGLYYVRIISADGQIEHKLKFIKTN